MGTMVIVNRNSVERLDELREQQSKADFLECAHDEQLGLSKEDYLLMMSVTQSVKLVDSHYSIGLPLRRNDVEMPHNRKVDERQALNLRRRFDKDSAFFLIIQTSLAISVHEAMLKRSQLRI